MTFLLPPDIKGLKAVAPIILQQLIWSANQLTSFDMRATFDV